MSKFTYLNILGFLDILNTLWEGHKNHPMLPKVDYIWIILSYLQSTYSNIVKFDKIRVVARGRILDNLRQF